MLARQNASIEAVQESCLPSIRRPCRSCSVCVPGDGTSLGDATHAISHSVEPLSWRTTNWNNTTRSCVIARFPPVAIMSTRERVLTLIPVRDHSLLPSPNQLPPEDILQ